MVHLSKLIFVAGAGLASGLQLDIINEKPKINAVETQKVIELKRQVKKTTKKTTKVETKHQVELESRDLKALWEGRDFPEEKLPLKDLEAVEVESAGKRNVHIFGLQSSGTSLLRTLLYTNFGRRLNYFDSETTSMDVPNRYPGFWTFSNFKEIGHTENDAVKELTEANVYSIAVVRNPYSWLQTIRTGPPLGCLQDCVEGDDWLVKPCIHNGPGGPESTIGRIQYQSLAGLWNHWTDGYAKASEFGFKKSLVVTFEDIVTNPEAILDQIVHFLKLEKSATDWVVPFNGDERDEQYQDLSHQGFMNNFLHKEKFEACVHLDPDVLAMVGYKAFNCDDFTQGPNRQFAPSQIAAHSAYSPAMTPTKSLASTPMAQAPTPEEADVLNRAEEKLEVLMREPVASPTAAVDASGPQPMFADTMTEAEADN